MTADDFDKYSSQERYDAALGRSLSVSGESKEFFARGRVATVRELAARVGAAHDRVLDFGCGFGDTAPILRDLLDASRVVGVDPSVSSIEHGREVHARERSVELLTSAELAANGSCAGAFDLCYTNGVFHHIAPRQRAAAVDVIRRALSPGGRVFFWENHAGNPATRFVMARCDFDDDAVPVWPHQARALLSAGGFDVENTVYRFLFPRSLSFLRPLEKRLLRLPVGAQYVVIARKP